VNPLVFYQACERERMATMMETMFPDLMNRAVLITGGASGIGAALATAFARNGCRIAIIDIDAAAGSALADKLDGSVLHRPVFIHADLSSVEATRQAVAKVASALGGLGVVVNNAARDDRHDAAELNEADWDGSQAVNLKSVFFVSQASLPFLKASGRGSIINFSSIAFLLNMGELPVYATAKAGIVGLTKSLAGAFGGHNIRVNALLPGMVVTERQKKLWLTDESIEAFRQRQCLKRTLVAEDMAGPCLFLASSASAAITAQSLIVDGGVL
jgi:NAD(P)-dependent dehydrogenase (short-subunit alcohol dehydrogenase family)